MITYVFKSEFEKKLKKLKIKTKFLKNVQCSNWNSNLSNIEKCRKLNTEVRWSGFISDAFDWTDTEDGHVYWNKIASN